MSVSVFSSSSSSTRRPVQHRRRSSTNVIHLHLYVYTYARIDVIRAVTRENAHAHTLYSASADYSAMQSFFGATHPHYSQLSSDVRLRWWTCSPCLSCCRCNVTPLTTFTFTLLLLLLVSFFAAEAVTTLHLQTSGSGDGFLLFFSTIFTVGTLF